MTPDDKYSLLNCDFLTQPMQMQLSKKQKNFSDLFSQFLNSRLDFEHFEKNDESHSLCVDQTTDSERPS